MRLGPQDGDWSGRQSGRAMPDTPILARLILRPIERFLAIETSGSIILLAVTALAIGWANSPWASGYEALWATPLTFGFGGHLATPSLHAAVDDGLMTIFFFVVGIEIRRELAEGELADLRRAALPVAAAAGGILAPAAIYAAFNAGGPAGRGWGVPMATDIAFAVGVLGILGKRVPPALRVFLLALAIIDDLGAILVIAFFYSAHIAPGGLALALGGALGIVVMRKMWLRRAPFYLVPAFLVWFGLLRAGVHATLAGVIVAFLSPAGPASRLQHALHPWVSYVVMPIFALANAGVALRFGGEVRPTLGIVLGLVVGKPAGITLACALAVRLGWASLPRGMSRAGVLVVGLVAGIGFTMAIFVAGLAFPSPEMLATAKLAVLAASVLAALAGLAVGRLVLPAVRADGGAADEHEAERSAQV